MLYSSTTGCKVLKIISFVIILIIIIGCEKTVKNVSFIDAKDNTPESIQKYFCFESSNDVSKITYNYLQTVNRAIGMKDSIYSDVEIRIVSSQSFNDTYCYRFLYNDMTWVGELFIIEYATFKIKRKESFVPDFGWKTFENTIVSNDILRISDIESSHTYIDSRDYNLQIITPKYTKIISLGDFYNNEEKDDNWHKVNTILKSIIFKD
ncbi:MAG TPA: hypothetical protein VLZ11_00505 [Flavobacterium sp.]|nr:hypothetical protein [Flavobacterium sp.]